MRHMAYESRVAATGSGTGARRFHVVTWVAIVVERGVIPGGPWGTRATSA